MAYIFLTLAIVLDTAGTVCMKLSDAFTRPMPVIGTSSLTSHASIFFPYP